MPLYLFHSTEMIYTRFAEKYAVKCCDRAAALHYKEMGLLTLSFVVHPTEGKELEVEL